MTNNATGPWVTKKKGEKLKSRTYHTHSECSHGIPGEDEESVDATDIIELLGLDECKICRVLRTRQHPIALVSTFLVEEYSVTEEEARETTDRLLEKFSSQGYTIRAK